MAGVIQTVRRAGPLILSIPHGGTDIPDDIEAYLIDADRARTDTDWWMADLYMPIAEALDATVVQTTLSRAVIDVNRDPSGRSLYPGRTTTGLVPLETFDGLPLWRDLYEPDVSHRLEYYYKPYHDALAAEIARIKGMHGQALVYDCHSIRSVLPRLFEGELPVFNIGTNGGASCRPEIASAVEEVCLRSGYSSVLNGRFKGGWITRHYGEPARGVHAVQMELAQRAYMREQPPAFDDEKAKRLRPTLQDVLAAMIAAAASRS